MKARGTTRCAKQVSDVRRLKVREGVGRVGDT